MDLNSRRVLPLIGTLCMTWLSPAAAGGSEPNGVGNTPDALYQVVVQGIRENCRKMECGVLTWQDTHGNATTKREGTETTAVNVYDAELRLAIDPKKSSFNDRSAIPEGTFTLEITDDIKTIADHRAGDPPLFIHRHEALWPTDAEPDDTASDAGPTLKEVIRCVEANEAKLSLIKMDFRTDYSSEGERPDYPRRHPGAGGRLPETRYQEVQWAQDGIRQRFVHSFFNQNGLRICQINVVDGETCKVGDWPELKRGTIRDVSGYSRWMVNFAAQLSYRPFYHPEEGAPLLSELLATAELLSDVGLQERNGRDVFVLDIRSGPLGCRRLYIDGERGVMVRWELYLGMPDSAGARLLQCLESTRFHQTENGGWLPVEGRNTYYGDGYTRFVDVRVDVNSISVDRADIPDSLFHLEYPEHTILSNTIRRDRGEEGL